jgi:hypothetical protein
MAGRKQKRLGCDLLVEVKMARTPMMGRILDVSLGGARIAGAQAVRPGFEVELRLMAPEKGYPPLLGRAEVVRGEQGDMAIRFHRADPVARVASSKLFQAVQQSWAAAPELSHPPVCCKDGHVLEPPLPHMKKRE